MRHEDVALANKILARLNTRPEITDDRRLWWIDEEIGSHREREVDMTPYTYRLHWSAKDGGWVCLCDQFKSLSYLSPDPITAVKELLEIVKDMAR